MCPGSDLLSRTLLIFGVSFSKPDALWEFDVTVEMKTVCSVHRVSGSPVHPDSLVAQETPAASPSCLWPPGVK